jgi:transposase-like protein
VAFDAFVETWVKYDKAAECLIKNRDVLLAFYDFPAEHWKHLRTTDEMDKRFFHDRDEDGRRGFHCDTNRS